MATQTPNLGLTKPEATDDVLATILALAENFRILDTIAEEGAIGSDRYVRFVNGFQMCWTGGARVDYSTTSSLMGTWTYPAAFATGPIVPAPAFPASGGNYEGGLNLNNVGSPFAVVSAGTASVTLYVWNNSRTWSAGHAISGLRVVALGRWK